MIDTRQPSCHTQEKDCVCVCVCACPYARRCVHVCVCPSARKISVCVCVCVLYAKSCLLLNDLALRRGFLLSRSKSHDTDTSVTVVRTAQLPRPNPDKPPLKRSCRSASSNVPSRVTCLFATLSYLGGTSESVKLCASTSSHPESKQWFERILRRTQDTFRAGH